MKKAAKTFLGIFIALVIVASGLYLIEQSDSFRYYAVKDYARHHYIELIEKYKFEAMQSTIAMPFTVEYDSVQRKQITLAEPNPNYVSLPKYMEKALVSKYGKDYYCAYLRYQKIVDEELRIEAEERKIKEKEEAIEGEKRYQEYLKNPCD